MATALHPRENPTDCVVLDQPTGHLVVKVNRLHGGVSEERAIFLPHSPKCVVAEHITCCGCSVVLKGGR
jgi:hypothetical protein